MPTDAPSGCGTSEMSVDDTTALVDRRTDSEFGFDLVPP
jgi:hypothetical protein